MDPDDGLYFDNKGINGNIGRAKFSYNSGQMIQAATKLYKITNDENYLNDARRTAASAHSYFFGRKAEDANGMFSLLSDNNIWFAAVLLRGFIELYNVDGDRTYLDTFQRNLAHAWDNAREPESGLFNADWSGEKRTTSYGCSIKLQ